MSAVICDMVRSCIHPSAPTASDTADPAQAPGAEGYQWKQVFLQSGTALRASFGGQAYFAVVEGSAIRCEQRALSPSKFANLQGSGNRNAWKALWLKFPGSQEWLRADLCRAARQTAIARLLEQERPASKASEGTNSTRPPMPAQVSPAVPAKASARPPAGQTPSKRHKKAHAGAARRERRHRRRGS
jgi:hypothetical protein